MNFSHIQKLSVISGYKNFCRTARLSSPCKSTQSSVTEVLNPLQSCVHKFSQTNCQVELQSLEPCCSTKSACSLTAVPDGTTKQLLATKSASNKTKSSKGNGRSIHGSRTKLEKLFGRNEMKKIEKPANKTSKKTRYTEEYKLKKILSNILRTMRHYGKEDVALLGKKEVDACRHISRIASRHPTHVKQILADSRTVSLTEASLIRRLYSTGKRIEPIVSEIKRTAYDKNKSRKYPPPPKKQKDKDLLEPLVASSTIYDKNETKEQIFYSPSLKNLPEKNLNQEYENVPYNFCQVCINENNMETVKSEIRRTSSKKFLDNEKLFLPSENDDSEYYKQITTTTVEQISKEEYFTAINKTPEQQLEDHIRDPDLESAENATSIIQYTKPTSDQQIVPTVPKKKSSIEFYPSYILTEDDAMPISYSPRTSHMKLAAKLDEDEELEETEIEEDYDTGAGRIADVEEDFDEDEMDEGRHAFSVQDFPIETTYDSINDGNAQDLSDYMSESSVEGDFAKQMVRNEPEKEKPEVSIDNFNSDLESLEEGVNNLEPEIKNDDFKSNLDIWDEAATNLNKVAESYNYAEEIKHIIQATTEEQIDKSKNPWEMTDDEYGKSLDGINPPNKIAEITEKNKNIIYTPVGTIKDSTAAINPTRTNNTKFSVIYNKMFCSEDKAAWHTKFTSMQQEIDSSEDTVQPPVTFDPDVRVNSRIEEMRHLSPYAKFDLKKNVYAEETDSPLDILKELTTDEKFAALPDNEKVSFINDYLTLESTKINPSLLENEDLTDIFNLRSDINSEDLNDLPSYRLTQEEIEESFSNALNNTSVKIKDLLRQVEEMKTWNKTTIPPKDVDLRSFIPIPIRKNKNVYESKNLLKHEGFPKTKRSCPLLNKTNADNVKFTNLHKYNLPIKKSYQKKHDTLTKYKSFEGFLNKPQSKEPDRHSQDLIKEIDKLILKPADEKIKEKNKNMSAPLKKKQDQPLKANEKKVCTENPLKKLENVETQAKTSKKEDNLQTSLADVSTKDPLKKLQDVKIQAATSKKQVNLQTSPADVSTKDPLKKLQDVKIQAATSKKEDILKTSLADVSIKDPLKKLENIKIQVETSKKDNILKTSLADTCTKNPMKNLENVKIATSKKQDILKTNVVDACLKDPLKNLENLKLAVTTEKKEEVATTTSKKEELIQASLIDVSKNALRKSKSTSQPQLKKEMPRQIPVKTESKKTFSTTSKTASPYASLNYLANYRRDKPPPPMKKIRNDYPLKAEKARGVLTVLLNPFKHLNAKISPQNQGLNEIENICKEELKALHFRRILNPETINTDECRSKPNFSKFIEKNQHINRKAYADEHQRKARKTASTDQKIKSVETIKAENTKNKDPKKILSIIDKIWEQVETEARKAVEEVNQLNNKTEKLNSIADLKEKASKQLQENSKKPSQDPFLVATERCDAKASKELNSIVDLKTKAAKHLEENRKFFSQHMETFKSEKKFAPFPNIPNPRRDPLSTTSTRSANIPPPTTNLLADTSNKTNTKTKSNIGPTDKNQKTTYSTAKEECPKKPAKKDPFGRNKPDPWKKKQRKRCPGNTPDLRLTMKAPECENDFCFADKELSTCTEDIVDLINFEHKPPSIGAVTASLKCDTVCRKKKKRKESECCAKDPCDYEFPERKKSNKDICDDVKPPKNKSSCAGRGTGQGKSPYVMCNLFRGEKPKCIKTFSYAANAQLKQAVEEINNETLHTNPVAHLRGNMKASDIINFEFSKKELSDSVTDIIDMINYEHKQPTICGIRRANEQFRSKKIFFESLIINSSLCTSNSVAKNKYTCKKYASTPLIGKKLEMQSIENDASHTKSAPVMWKKHFSFSSVKCKDSESPKHNKSKARKLPSIKCKSSSKSAKSEGKKSKARKLPSIKCGSSSKSAKSGGKKSKARKLPAISCGKKGKLGSWKSKEKKSKSRKLPPISCGKKKKSDPCKKKEDPCKPKKKKRNPCKPKKKKRKGKKLPSVKCGKKGKKKKDPCKKKKNPCKPKKKKKNPCKKKEDPCKPKKKKKNPCKPKKKKRDPCKAKDKDPFKRGKCKPKKKKKPSFICKPKAKKAPSPCKKLKPKKKMVCQKKVTYKKKDPCKKEDPCKKKQKKKSLCVKKNPCKKEDPCAKLPKDSFNLVCKKGSGSKCKKSSSSCKKSKKKFDPCRKSAAPKKICVKKGIKKCSNRLNSSKKSKKKRRGSGCKKKGEDPCKKKDPCKRKKKKKNPCKKKDPCKKKSDPCKPKKKKKKSKKKRWMTDKMPTCKTSKKSSPCKKKKKKKKKKADPCKKRKVDPCKKKVDPCKKRKKDPCKKKKADPCKRKKDPCKKPKKYDPCKDVVKKPKAKINRVDPCKTSTKKFKPKKSDPCKKKKSNPCKRPTKKTDPCKRKKRDPCKPKKKKKDPCKKKQDPCKKKKDPCKPKKKKKDPCKKKQDPCKPKKKKKDPCKSKCKKPTLKTDPCKKKKHKKADPCKKKKDPCKKKSKCKKPTLRTDPCKKMKKAPPCKKSMPGCRGPNTKNKIKKVYYDPCTLPKNKQKLMSKKFAVKMKSSCKKTKNKCLPPDYKKKDCSNLRMEKKKKVKKGPTLLVAPVCKDAKAKKSKVKKKKVKCRGLPPPCKTSTKAAKTNFCALPKKVKPCGSGKKKFNIPQCLIDIRNKKKNKNQKCPTKTWLTDRIPCLGEIIDDVPKKKRKRRLKLPKPLCKDSKEKDKKKEKECVVEKVVLKPGMPPICSQIIINRLIDLTPCDPKAMCKKKQKKEGLHLPVPKCKDGAVMRAKPKGDTKGKEMKAKKEAKGGPSKGDKGKGDKGSMKTASKSSTKKESKGKSDKEKGDKKKGGKGGGGMKTESRRRSSIKCSKPSSTGSPKRMSLNCKKDTTPIHSKICRSNPNMYTRDHICKFRTPFKPPKMVRIQKYKFTILGPKACKDHFDTVCKRNIRYTDPPPKKTITANDFKNCCFKLHKIEVTEEYLDQVEDMIEDKKCESTDAMKEIVEMKPRKEDERPIHFKILKTLEDESDDHCNKKCYSTFALLSPGMLQILHPLSIN